MHGFVHDVEPQMSAVRESYEGVGGGDTHLVLRVSSAIRITRRQRRNSDVEI